MRLEKVRVGMRVRVMWPPEDPDEGVVFELAVGEEYPVCVLLDDGYPACFKAEELELVESMEARSDSGGTGTRVGRGEVGSAAGRDRGAGGAGGGAGVRVEDVRVGMRVRVTRGAWRQVQGRTGTVIAIGNPQYEPPIRVQIDGWRRPYRFWPNEVEPAEAMGRGA